MMIDRAGIARLVPHAGAMCLLDGVTEWSATSIACASALPAAGHPLGCNDRVSAIAAVEYAAQATAVHGALLERNDRPRAGMLARLMDVRLSAASVPLAGDGLTIRADLLSRSAGGCMYSFEVSVDKAPLASGRLMVALLPENAT
ncbi:MAG TPA: 3-hydroxylacyl-ACP dehydratase [Ramlibacter sp.]|nr:3-hydroxylacyl-ACP dehydratase [Ramlibacter sp.]